MTTQQHTIRDRTLRMAQKLGDRSGSAYENDGYIKIDVYTRNAKVSLHSFSHNNYMYATIWDTSHKLEYIATISQVQDDDLLESLIRQVLAHHNVKL